jgi:hypothetical protein
MSYGSVGEGVGVFVGEDVIEGVGVLVGVSVGEAVIDGVGVLVGVGVGVVHGSISTEVAGLAPTE